VTSYDGYAGEMQERLTTAYEEVRRELRKAAERNKRYYDVKAKPHRYVAGDWVYYYNPRKRPGKQNKWEKKYSGPYLVIDTPSPVNVVIQRSVKAKPATVHVHIDKIKPYTGEPPDSWLSTANEKQEVAVQTESNYDVPANDNVPEQNSQSPEITSPAGLRAKKESVTDAPTKHIAGPNSDYVIDEPAQPLRPKRVVKPPAKFEDYEWKPAIVSVHVVSRTRGKRSGKQRNC